MTMSPDQIVLWQLGWLSINATLVSTWLVMALLVVGSVLLTRSLVSDRQIGARQNLLEVLVDGLQKQIRQVSGQAPRRFLPFIGTLFLFIFVANMLAIVPGYQPPTASLSTTVALALSVFIAVPVFGIARQGLGGYLKRYAQPSIVMLPFNVIGELSRTFALAVRLYGNMMSGTVIVAILLSIAPLFFPVLLQLLGMLTGAVQAYIFAVLAAVYIALATQVQQEVAEQSPQTDYQPGESR